MRTELVLWQMGKSGGRKKKANAASGEGSTKLDPDDAVGSSSPS